MSDWFHENDHKEQPTPIPPIDETPRPTQEENTPPPVETPTPVETPPTHTPSGYVSPAPPVQGYPYTPTPPAPPSGYVSPAPPVQAYPSTTSPTPPSPNWGEPPLKKKRNPAAAITAVLAVVCAGTIVTLSVLLYLANNGDGLPNVPVAPSSSEAEGNPNAPSLNITDDETNDGGLSAKEIINRNMDSTVVISTYEPQTGNGFGFEFGADLKPASGASGIIMAANGYIITNRHCVINEQTNKAYGRVDVILHDGTVYTGAKIIGTDQSTDLAVIKIEAKDLKVATFGDSSKLTMGDRVVALGNAGGLEWSASQGIVSGLTRDVYEDTGYAIKCLQTDAAINPGNSGGPLLNNQGQVIGVNSAKIVANGYEGLGFSIPINEAKSVVDDLLKYGYVKGRVMLGITGITIDQSNYQGFLIKTIEKGSSLEGTRASAGDLVTHVNGKRVKNYSEMRSELSKYKVGDRVEMTLLRIDSRTKQEVTFNIQCTLAESKP